MRLVFLRLSRLLLAVALLLSFYTPAQATNSFSRARQTLENLSPEERVGQLFLVSFQGIDAGVESQIYDLIVNHHVGGVALTAANDNFVAAPDTAAQAQQLIIQLQQAEWDASAGNAPGVAGSSTYIPLFIAISQEGGGAPNDQILSGLTPLPDQMALGAAWNPVLSSEVGKVMGRELSVLGFNLYLGLSLDVLSNPKPALTADLSTRVFGGDPYWVGELGRAYMNGLREGSQGHIAVIARHFPGRGGTDRAPEQEVATVRRSLEELKQIELPPFFALTANPENSLDGLLVSHIRYQGFQGNIRATTRPVSFDQQALTQMLTLPELANWRQRGGIVVSDDLGTAAVRRFYDPNQQGFSTRLVARDAFLAGNDLLYMGNILSSDAEDNYSSVLRALESFTQKYREDPAFASRVDESVLRILALKERLYPSNNFSLVRPLAGNLAQLNQSAAVTFEVSRQSATLFSPSASDFSNVLPDPPSSRDYIVFITDSRLARQCSTCPEQAAMPVNALQNAVINLYGPKTGALIQPDRLSSFSFDDLALYLDGLAPNVNLSNNLRRATWVVFSTLDLSEGKRQTATFRRFFAEKQGQLLNKRLILFSFGAPYYLDATDIANLTAYYGMYSESPPFVEMAARLLFQELTPVGASPVSIPGLGYDLISATSPNPRQVISLQLDAAPAVSVTATPTDSAATAEPTLEPVYRVGDSLSVRTGVIFDHNGRQVPDGTVVRFTLTQGESGILQQQDVVTSQGVARVAFRLEKPGLVQVSAASEPATSSDVLQLNITSEGATVIIITPTVMPTELPTPTLEPTPSPTPTPGFAVHADGSPTFWGWFLVMLALFAGVAFAYWLASQFIDSRWAIRWALLTLLCGLFAYNYLALELPGGRDWVQARGLAAFLQAVLIGQFLGVLLGLAWRSLSPNKK